MRERDGYSHRSEGSHVDRNDRRSSWREDGGSRGGDRRKRYEPGSRNYDAAPVAASSPSRRPSRRSRSPSSRAQGNFEADRAREREAYYARQADRSPPRNGPQRSSADRGDERPNSSSGEEAKMAPDFTSSGLLAAESNSKSGVALKYHEPPEARKPRRKWRLYVFVPRSQADTAGSSSSSKGARADVPADVLHISRQSAYLLGRDRSVADIPIDHPSASKQHAVIQYRNIIEKNDFGDEKRAIKPFLIDLESANGCTVNGTEVPASRYYELRNGDTIRIGASSREYVLLAED